MRPHHGQGEGAGGGAGSTGGAGPASGEGAWAADTRSSSRAVSGSSCRVRAHGGAAAPCAPRGRRSEDDIAGAAWIRSAGAGHG
jgi:hypothetical protein